MRRIYQNRQRYTILLQGILLKNYRAKAFAKTENIVKYFLINKLAKVTKKSYNNNVYTAYVYYLWEAGQENFFKNLPNIATARLGSRASADALLFVNNCVNALDICSRHKSTLDFKKSTEEEEEKELEEALLLYYLISKINNDYLKSANKKLKKINNNVADNLNQSRLNESRLNQSRLNESALNESALNQSRLNESRLNESRLKKNAIYKEIANQFKNDRWRSAFLPNSRQTHKNASGQKRGADGYFNVGGELLRFPSDFVNGSVGNCINCKCYLQAG